MRRALRTRWLCLLWCLACTVGATAAAQEAAPADAQAPAAGSTATRNGREIYQDFRAGLADPSCDADATTPRWRQHFAGAPKRLAAKDDDLLPLFGYVVDSLRAAHLPTEFALIPFVESGYRPGARSPSGPAGLWQMIALTARNHGVPMRNGYDGRLSSVDSTRAAVRYLKTLHGMFAGDWRLAVMAYNAGEYRVLGALKRSGQNARDVELERLSMPDITVAYVRKLHALSCLLEQADDREEWMKSLDRPVPRLQAVELPGGVNKIGQWAARTDQDAARLQRLNPVFADGRVTGAGGLPARLLAVSADDRGDTVKDAVASVAPATADTTPDNDDEAAPARRHTVARGESAWTIAKRYGLSAAELLKRNGLGAKTVLKPGQTLAIDPLEALADGVHDKTGVP